MSYSAEQVPDQKGKIIVVTGANGGIGYEAARVLAARGARVVLACRDEAKMKSAAQTLGAAVPGATIETVVLDLSSLDSVRAAAATLAARHERIDVLVNNAGIMAIPYRENAVGAELQFATNHLGHFALTGLLLARVGAAPAGRVVTVSSLLHPRGRMVFEDLPKPRRYHAARTYAMTKLANLLFAYELDRRLQAAGSRARSLACHPGYSATNLQQTGPRMAGSAIGAWLANLGNALFAQPAAAGALGTLFAATSADAQGGDYIGPTGLFGLRGKPVRARSSAASHDRDAARKLWELSERLAGVRYELPSG